MKMAGEDRYSQSPKVKGGKVEKPERAAAAKETETAGSPPSDTNMKGADKATDAGPEKGGEATMVSERHAKERGDMLGRHKREHEEMVARHHDEHQKMAKRHEKETMEAAPNKDEATATREVKADAGKPKELGKEKDEGKRGTEP
jgi:hypothetical protein